MGIKGQYSSYNWFTVISLFAFLSVVDSISNRKDVLVLPNPEQNVMPFEPVRYSNPNVSNNYQSSTKINARGMGHLYYITKKFMDFILEGQAFPEGFIEVKNSQIVISDDYYSLVMHYGTLVLVLICGLLLGVIVPFIGLIFCCCRCTGKCGARTQPFDKRYDTCRRHFLALILSSLTVVIMFGVVCAIVTNEYMEEGAQNIPKTVRTSVRDTKLYINNTRKEVNTLLVVNFGELDVVLNRLLRRSGEIVKDKLGEISKAAVLSNLTTIVQGLKTIRTDLNNMDSLTKALQKNARALEIALKGVREMLLERLKLCRNERACMEFLSKYNITALTLEANFTQLPDVTISLQNVSGLLANDIESEVIKGRDQFDRIKLSIQRSVDRTIPDIALEIKKAGDILKKKADSVTKVLDKIESYIDSIPYKKVDEGEVFLRQYAQYRYYTGLGVSLVLVVVLFCLAIGLLCGYCGHRPDPLYNDDCCDKGTASRFLMLGVWVMFLTFSGVLFITLGYTLTGSIADRVICAPLHNPNNDSTFALVDNLVNISAIFGPPPNNKELKLSSIISECHKNRSIYEVLDLDSGSMAEYTQRFNLPEKVRQLSDSIVLSSNIVIITPAAEQQLRALAASPLNTIDLTLYTAVLNDKITSIDLLQMASALNHTAMKLPPSQENVKTMLQTEAMYLEVHQEKQVSVMVQLSKELHGNASLLSNHLRFNHSSLKHAVDSLLSDLKQAQRTLNSQGPAIVRKLAEEFGKEFGIHIDSYLAKVESEASHNIGKCWPISLVYNSTMISVCNNILDPYNGFWLSVGCVVLLFLPSIILSVKLASLYQKSDPYPGALVEAVGGKKKRRQKKKHGSSSGGAYSAPLGRGERSQPIPPTDDRPAQWDQFNANVPPRYPAISSEYERPPPYYFPGPNQPVTASNP
ncbi:hypothetical protein O3M35_006341 [Rhynocoris fuscipes]|uniref:Prominin-like protein n=1 Tax=Rhynocoris fuscipes TaxID=488301 RepID=A0AAW1DKE3_9HEMI